MDERDAAEWAMLVKDLNLLKDVENNRDLWEYIPTTRTGLLTSMLAITSALLYVLHMSINTKILTGKVIHYGMMANL